MLCRGRASGDRAAMSKLIIRLTCARNLGSADSFGGSDPYAKISFNGSVLGRTETVKSNVNPTWKKGVFEVDLPEESVEVLASRLHVEVYDKDTMGSDDFLGECTVVGEALLDENEDLLTTYHALVAREGMSKKEKKLVKGEVGFILEYVPASKAHDTGPVEIAHVRPDDVDGEMIPTSLRLQIVDASGLKRHVHAGGLDLPDVYCCTEVFGLPGGDKLVAETPLRPGTVAPSWDGAYVQVPFPSDHDALKHMILRVRVMDLRNRRCLGHVSWRGAQILHPGAEAEEQLGRFVFPLVQGRASVMAAGDGEESKEEREAWGTMEGMKTAFAVGGSLGLRFEFERDRSTGAEERIKEGAEQLFPPFSEFWDSSQRQPYYLKHATGDVEEDAPEQKDLLAPRQGTPAFDALAFRAGIPPCLRSAWAAIAVECMLRRHWARSRIRRTRGAKRYAEAVRAAAEMAAAAALNEEGEATEVEAAVCDWVESFDPSLKLRYYYNADTEEIAWTKPAELLDTEARALELEQKVEREKKERKAVEQESIVGHRTALKGLRARLKVLQGIAPYNGVAEVREVIAAAEATIEAARTKSNSAEQAVEDANGSGKAARKVSSSGEAVEVAKAQMDHASYVALRWDFKVVRSAADERLPAVRALPVFTGNFADLEVDQRPLFRAVDKAQEHLDTVLAAPACATLHEQLFSQVVEMDVAEVHAELHAALATVILAERSAVGTQKLVNVAEAREREQAELALMAQEEHRQRKVEAEIKWRQHERLARRALVQLCQGAWRDGRKLRDRDAVEKARREAQEKLDKEGADVRRKKERQQRLTKIEELYCSPWEAAMGGASVDRFDQLLHDEAQRRQHQEGRSFSLNDRDSETGDTLLLCACAGGHRHLVKFLLENGASVHTTNNTIYRVTPLHEAAQNNFVEVVEELLAAGARVDEQDGHGDTPVHLAVRKGLFAVLCALLKLPASQRGGRGSAAGAGGGGTSPMDERQERGGGGGGESEGMVGGGESADDMRPMSPEMDEEARLQTERLHRAVLTTNYQGHTPLDLARKDRIQRLLSQFEMKAFAAFPQFGSGTMSYAAGGGSADLQPEQHGDSVAAVRASSMAGSPRASASAGGRRTGKKGMKKSLSAAATTGAVGAFDESFDLTGRADMASRSAALLPSASGGGRMGSPVSSVRGGGRSPSSSSGMRVISDHAVMKDKLEKIKQAYKNAHKRRGAGHTA